MLGFRDNGAAVGLVNSYLYDGYGSVRGTATLESAPNAPGDQGLIAGQRVCALYSGRSSGC